MSVVFCEICGPDTGGICNACERPMRGEMLHPMAHPYHRHVPCRLCDVCYVDCRDPAEHLHPDDQPGGKRRR